MEPRIQYAKTEDGVSIAFWVLGEGAPLVIPPLLVASHVQMEWQVASRRAAYELLAERSTVIRYDCRGMGMSERAAIDFSLDAATRDLEAVTERLALDRFALFSQRAAGSISFAYAASHPDRVGHLVHNERRSGMTRPGVGLRMEIIEPIMDQDWDLYAEIWARLLAGWNSRDAEALATLIQASHSAASVRLAQRALKARSAEEFASGIAVPTLILHALGDEEETEAATGLASRIGDAHVVGIPGATMGPYTNDIGLTAILDFINSPTSASGRSPSPHVDTQAVRTVLFTDVEAHASMMERLGDSGGRDVLREHERVTRQVLKEHGGAEVKAMGDGFMASFGSVTKAMDCAIALQRAFATHSDSMPEPLHVRVGLNAGEPIEEDGDLFGSTVILASRIAAKAEGGEILVADTVRGLCSGKGFLFADRGEFVAKGFEEPMRVYEVNWRE